ncbi:hypothetical protein OSB04_024595 [Centaurea solstitialis]|uniref:Retrotransposon gag domain-containing protein n=1 Tax=Centaurea solstitialis TaxID=347529 RepID=A0AA38SM21_9ASTR|nr:hypothetical protein OSB04_024595 [Centaurea solstitialis]
MRVDIPEFSDKTHPDEFIKWLSTVEPSCYQSSQLCFLMVGSYEETTAFGGKIQGRSLGKVKKLIQGKFLPANRRQVTFLDYHNLTQRGLSVNEFINEFVNELERLRMRCDVSEEEEQIITRFLGGLRAEITDVSYADVCRLALKVEKQYKGKGRMYGGRPTSVPKPTLAPTKAPMSKTSPTMSTAKSRSYLEGVSESVGISLVEEETSPVFYSDHQDEGVDEKEEVVYADYGELLVVQ